MPTEAPTSLAPKAAAVILRTAIKDPARPLTIADAATASGLALRDAERGLHALTSEYRGHLRATSEGELLFLFPHGFAKPWETRSRISRALGWLGRAAIAAIRFIVRAWVVVVLLGYAALFVALIIALTFGGRGSDRRSSGGGGALAYVFFRVLADAMFWTFHPFSPISVGYAGGWGMGSSLERGRSSLERGRGSLERGRGSLERGRSSLEREPASEEPPFYEKVNRFFFGPTKPKDDPREMERKILAELRAKKGRIGLADVMRVTGYPREIADGLMARLMLDYDGEVDVSEDGGIFYSFESMRKTAATEGEARPRPAWEEKKQLPPLTGNTGGTNFLIACINAFNLALSAFVIDQNLTLSRLVWMFSRHPHFEAAPPYDGVPIALGVIPLIFSIALFALPLARALGRAAQAKAVAKENARLEVLKTVLTRVEAKTPVDEKSLVDAWQRGAGTRPASKELTREVVRLGGDVEIGNAGEVRYRFVDLETEQRALEAEREVAEDEEKAVGRVVFASDA